MSIFIEFKCKKHPKYKAIFRPKDCPDCLELYRLKRLFRNRWYYRSTVELGMHLPLLSAGVYSKLAQWVSIERQL